MRIDVLDGDTLERVGYVDTWVSLLWTDSYNTMTACTLEVRATAYNEGLFKQGRWMMRSDSNIPVRICSISTQNTAQNLVIAGFDARWILTKRVSTETVGKENAETAMRRLVSAMLPWPNLELGDLAGLDTKYTNQTTGGSVFDYCTTIGQACDMGFRVRASGTGDSRRLVFEVYQPAQDENRKYSEAFGNLVTPMYQFSDSDYYNVAVVQGAGSGDERVTITAGDTAATGADRREMYVDARDIQPSENETTDSAAYLARLENRGLTKLQEQTEIKTIEFEVQDETLEVGDVVVALLPKLGYNVTARVSEITLQSQKDKTTRTVRVGTPTLERRG